MTYVSTATSLLKSYGANPLPNMPDLPQLLSCWARDKQYNVEAIARLTAGNAFGRLMQGYFMGNQGVSTPAESQGAINNAARNMARKKEGDLHSIDTYIGTREDNELVDHALSESLRPNLFSRFGRGSLDRFVVNPFDIPADVSKVEIAIIGQGAAGILADRTLRAVGFRNVTVYERSRALGIWANENVYSRSRNNPVRLSWSDNDLEPAPGNGESVRTFLNAVLKGGIVKQATVKTIVPGYNYNHRIEFAENTIENKTVPIIINCSGIGTPKPINDKNKMSTTSSTTEAGERWQRKLEASECRRKKFVFIGLGNSTAEMIRQIHNFQDLGIEVDYKIMTHYPKDAVYNPEDTVETKDGRKYRVFRDLSLPNLTSWQGDLTESRYDYYRALRSGCIVPGIHAWSREHEGKTLVCKTNRGGYDRATFNEVDHLFTLIGYMPNQLTLEHFGIKVNSKDHCPELDYDGEVQTGDSDQGRLYRGYFAFGSMTTNPQNKNAIVIPGMLFRLNDLVTSVVLRAAEVALQSL